MTGARISASLVEQAARLRWIRAMNEATPVRGHHALGVQMPSRRQWWTMVGETIGAWIADYAPSMGAALSYYTVFSLAPTLLIVISVAGLVFGAQAVRGEIVGQLSNLMGPSAAAAIQQVLAGLHEPSQGWLGSAIGIVLLAAGATSVFGELQNALDRIWRAKARQSSGLFGLIRAPLGVLWHDPRHRVPADRLAGAECGHLGARQVVGRRVRKLGAAGADGQCKRRFCHHHRLVRRDLQDDSPGIDPVERRVAGRGRDRRSCSRPGDC